MTGPFGMGVLKPLSGLPYWRDYDPGQGSTLTLSGSTVTAIADNQGVGPTLGNASGLIDPILGATMANVQAGIRFDPGDGVDGSTSGNLDTLWNNSNSSNIYATGISTGVSMYVVFCCTSANSQLFGAYGNAPSSRIFQLWLDGSGRVAFRWIDDGSTTRATVNTTAAFNDGNWHIARLTFSGGNVSLEVDGGNRATTTYTTGTTTIAREAIGSRTTFVAQQVQYQPFDGAIARVLIYNTDHDGAAIATSVYAYLNARYLVPPVTSTVIASMGTIVGASGTARPVMPEDVRAGDIAVLVVSKTNGNGPTTPTGWTLRLSGDRGHIFTRTCASGDGLREVTMTIAGTNVAAGIAVFRNYFAAEAPQNSATTAAVGGGTIPFPTITPSAQPHYCLATAHGQFATSGSTTPSGTNPTYTVLGTNTSGTAKVVMAGGSSTSTSALGVRTASEVPFTGFYHGMTLSWLLL